ncbi:IucA/IucC family siderophore biosynthesis protein [Photobacterium sp. GB-56]|uniref:IucA/IucC family protein n=1 Tax=Photobacterium sp. GB-56 TaxID=2022106 RepID=UPI000D186CCA|nr:IucA/IucC family protein [Photobacterium sp. GB-56]PSV25502.1 short-chain isoprenyl diphosphate synthase [Photobacterium sp. GB-56]
MPLPNCLTLEPEQRIIKQIFEAIMFEQLVEIDVGSENGYNTFTWIMAEKHYHVRGHIGAFGRYRLDISTLTIDGQPQLISQSWEDIVRDLPALEQVKLSIIEEFKQTSNLCRWNQDNIPARDSRRQASFIELEAQLDEGHPYHPSFKARTGFNFLDHQCYGPEAGESFCLHWIAIKRTHFRSHLPDEHDRFWSSELDQDHWQTLSFILSQQQGNWQEYALLPVHPWQWRQLHKEDFPSLLDQKIIIDLGELGDQYVASQSVRTLLNVTNKAKANIKLPLNMVNTSSKRTLAGYSVCLAPEISTWLETIVSQDPELSGLDILAEYAGGIYVPLGKTVECDPLSDQLAVIFRESLEKKLSPEQTAVPFNALMMVEQDGQPFIDHWIDKYGLVPWLSQLIEVAVIPIWHLLVKYGVGTEPHGQNMVLVHRNGWPEKIIIRDFHESVEYHSAFLSTEFPAPDLALLEPTLAKAPLDIFYAMSSVELLRELVMDTLFIYNLAEVSHLIEWHYGGTERQFWQLVENKLEQYSAAHPELADRIAQLDYQSTSIATESLLARKFQAKKQECHHIVSNALSCAFK